MLEIKLSQDRDTLAALCRECGALPTHAHYLYTAVDGGRQLAAVLFEVGSEEVRALHYRAEDESDCHLFDALLRAGFHYASGQGIRTGCLPESFRMRHARHFARLNYPPQASFDITNFFQKYKSCALGAQR